MTALRSAGRWFVGALFAVASVSSQAAFVYTVSDGITTTTVTPISTAETGVDYYDFSSASGHPAFTAEDDKAFFWLHRDSNTSDLTLGFIFDQEDPGNSGSGNVNMTTAGFPTGSVVLLGDDGGEVATLINDTETFVWNAANTDGAVVGGFGNGPWSIDLTFNSFSGLGAGFFFVDGPAEAGSADIPLAMSPGGTITIAATAVAVPAPMPLALLVLGALGLLVQRRKA